MDIETIMKSVITQFKITKVGPYYYMGGSKKPVDSRTITDKLGRDLTKTMTEASLEEMLDRLIDEAMKGKIVSKDKMFDKSPFATALAAIVEHEELDLDFAYMEFRQIVGYDSKLDEDGNKIPLYNTITPDKLRTFIQANEDARAFNTDTKAMTSQIINYVDYYKIEQTTESLKKIIELTKFDPKYITSGFNTIDNMHKAYNCKEDIEIWRMLIKHFFWILKRRTIQKPVYNDLMIFLRGAQGIGKSFLLKAIFEEVYGKYLAQGLKVSQITDERWTPALGNLILGIIDEADTGVVEKLSGKGMASFKSQLTADRIMYRPLGTNTTIEIAKKITYISTSNFHIYDVFNDETGMRRFFEFNSAQAHQVRFDATLVADIRLHAIDIFKSIDENLEHGYWDIESEVGKKITAIQNTYVEKKTEEDFINEYYTIDDNLEWEKCLDLETVYTEYVTFCRARNVKENYIITRKNFRKKIEGVLESQYDCIKVKHHNFRFKLVPKKKYDGLNGIAIDEELDL